jgi:uncharacterized protein YjiS (DUF1127 family)
MTYMTTTQAPAATGLPGFLAGLRQSIATRIRKNRVFHDTRAELEAMTDRELADIGLTRFMIDDIAAQAAASA